MNLKILNQKALEESHFLDRFLGFIEAYDAINETIFFESAKKWVEKKDFHAIKCYLLSNPIEYSCPFTIKDFAFMTEEEIKFAKEQSVKILALLDEKKALNFELRAVID